MEDNDNNTDINTKFNVSVNDKDISDIGDQMSIILYLAGYCTHTLLKRLKCEECLQYLTIEKELAVDPKFNYIHTCDRGGLKYPEINVVNAVVHNFVIIKKIVGGDQEKSFLKCSNQREVVIDICIKILHNKDMSLMTCNKHNPVVVLKQILRSSTNILLKNYCKTKNDISKIIKKDEATTYSATNVDSSTSSLSMQKPKLQKVNKQKRKLATLEKKSFIKIQKQ